MGDTRPEISRIIAPHIPLEIVGERRYRLEANVLTQIQFTSGETLGIFTAKNFLLDMRSGPFFLDWIHPHVGDQHTRRGAFIHDSLFALAAECTLRAQEPPISFEFANQLFRDIDKLSQDRGGGGLSSWRCWLSWVAVETEFGKRAYEIVDSVDYKNRGKVHVFWSGKQISRGGAHERASTTTI